MFRESIGKLDAYAIQLKQLNDRTHPGIPMLLILLSLEICEASKRIENWLGEQKLRNQILHDHKIDEIHRQYDLEIKGYDRDCSVSY